VKTESATPPNQRDEAQNRDGVRGNHPFFKTLLGKSIALCCPKDSRRSIPRSIKNGGKREKNGADRMKNRDGDGKRKRGNVAL
jgi:hypothetical protein